MAPEAAGIERERDAVGEQQLPDLEPGSPRSGLLEVLADLVRRRRAHGRVVERRAVAAQDAAFALGAADHDLRPVRELVLLARAELEALLLGRRRASRSGRAGARSPARVRRTSRPAVRARAATPGRRSGARRPRSRAGGPAPRAVAGRRDSGRGSPGRRSAPRSRSDPIARHTRGVNGRSSSSPGWTMPTWDSGTSFHAPSRSPSGSETTTRVSSERPASSTISG